MTQDKRSETAQAILEYLHEHPDAQDTLAGIAEWWLPEEKTKARLAIVKAALHQLAAEGLVLERRSKDSQTHYRINGQRLQEIEKLVRRAKPPRPNT
jgi:Fe2+ or Zn2+ uptake regulation protein